VGWSWSGSKMCWCRSGVLQRGLSGTLGGRMWSVLFGDASCRHGAVVVEGVVELVVGLVPARRVGRGDVDWRYCLREVVGTSGSVVRLVGEECEGSWTMLVGVPVSRSVGGVHECPWGR
jgi:hypothetical protein